MKDQRELFNDAAFKAQPGFFVYIKSCFGAETAQKVLDAFEKLDIPMPSAREEYMAGTEGALAFLNPYGVVIRIERKQGNEDTTRFGRFESPWILQPLASIDAGNVVIEICPGCFLETEIGNIYYLTKQLAKQNIDFWDMANSNSGRLPIKTPAFPEGVPIVIDRLAVALLTEGIAPVKAALDTAEIREAAEAAEKLYAPLRRSFGECFPDKQRMQEFWDLCKSYVREGKLIAAWDAGDVTLPEMQKMIKLRHVPKRDRARISGRYYESKLQAAAGERSSSTVPAVPRSRPRSA